MIYPNLGTSIPNSNVQIFNAGNHSWMKPRGASMLYFEVVAAGGGGGGGYVSGSGGAGGGGSGGSGFIYMVPAMFVPDALYFSVGFGGAGGSPGAPGSSGSTGGNTSIVFPPTNQNLITCTGGNGGGAGAAAADGATGSTASAPAITYFISFGILTTFAGGTITSPVFASTTYRGTLAGGAGSGVALGSDLRLPMASWLLPVGVDGSAGGSSTYETSPFLRGIGGNGGGRGSAGAYPAGNGGLGVLGCGGGGGGGWANDGGGFGGKGGDGFILVGFY